MPRLIVLNGPPGCGKSTIAARYAAGHPMALNLDIDVVRRLIGGWQDQPHEAGLAARSIALAAARTHLGAGHDVVVAQYLGRVDYLQQLAGLASELDVEYRELVLFETKDVAVRRFQARTLAAREPAHTDAQELLDRVGGVPQLEAMYDRLLLVIAARPVAKLVPAPEGEIDATYEAVLAAVDGSRSTTTGA